MKKPIAAKQYAKTSVYTAVPTLSRLTIRVAITLRLRSDSEDVRYRSDAPNKLVSVIR